MADPLAPRSLGSTREISFTGKIFPWDPVTQQPVLLSMPGSTAFYLPCFSKKEGLQAVMQHIRFADYTIKLIQDGGEFRLSILEAVGGTVHLILDPYIVEGKVRFSQVVSN